MGDESLQELRRKASEGDEGAAARLKREFSRLEESLRSWLSGLVGKQLFIEGIRINYRGVLSRIIWNGDGTPAGLLFEQLQRVSYFNKSGPDTTWTMVHQKERYVPWDSIHDIGEESFQLENIPAGWR